MRALSLTNTTPLPPSTYKQRERKRVLLVFWFVEVSSESSSGKFFLNITYQKYFFLNTWTT
jgi:hypothetical protein